MTMKSGSPGNMSAGAGKLSLTSLTLFNTHRMQLITPGLALSGGAMYRTRLASRIPRLFRQLGVSGIASFVPRRPAR